MDDAAHLLVLILSMATAGVSSKGVVLLQESQQQTFAYPLGEAPTAAFEDHILDILELEEPPLLTRRKRSDKVTSFMAQLYNELEESVDSSVLNGVEEWSNADRIVSFTPKESKATSGLTSVTFAREDIPDLIPSQLIAAQLRIFLPKELTIAKVFILTNKTGTLSLVDSTIATSRENTVGFNITHMVSDWMEGQSEPTVFIGIDGGLEALPSRAELESFVVASFTDERDYVPPPRTRTRRAVGDAPPQETGPPERKSIRSNPFTGTRAEEVEGCHVQSLYLNFADIGWREWVIAPEGYSTNYCAGACSSDSPMHSKMNATNHAIVQTLVHLVDPKRAEEAKCAPIQLSPTKILFIDNHGNVVMRRYQDMTVQECGCL